jgi:hypothetical protein
MLLLVGNTAQMSPMLRGQDKQRVTERCQLTRGVSCFR